MSMFAGRMHMLTAVVMDQDRKAVVKALVERGVMEFIHIDSLPEEKMKKLEERSFPVSRATLTDLRQRVEAMMRSASLVVPELSHEELERISSADVDEYTHELDKLSARVQSVKDKQKVVNQNLKSAEELKSYAENKNDDFLDIRVGKLTRGEREALRERLYSFGGVFSYNEVTGIVSSMTFRRDSSRVTEVLDKFGFAESPDPAVQKEARARLLIELAEKIENYKSELSELSESAVEKIRERESDLSSIWKILRVNELCEDAESYFSYTKNTTLFSGWVPEENYMEIDALIRSVTSGKCIIEWTSDRDVPRESVPVKLESPRFMKPFDTIVRKYGTPEYGSINPTPFTMIAYMLMFALMFADLGQGLVLLLIGIFGSINYKRHPLKRDGLISRYLCSLLLYLGPASMVGGILFGSCFGYSVFPALWFNYHSVVNGHGGSGFVQSIYDILAITVWFGIGVIYVGLILNWINLIRKRRIAELVFDKNGLVGGGLFALGIWCAYGYIKSGYHTFPKSAFLYPCLLLGILILILKTPVEYVMHRRHGGSKKGAGQLITDTIMELLVEALEIFSGFLANTLSFMRVAGLGIAHVSLMTAFESMSEMTGNILFKILIMIVGNLLVIALEGLSAGIQSLRLNYYEFFTKYFTGRGMPYNPINLDKQFRADK